MGGPGILASFLHSCLDWYQDQDGWWLVPELTIPYHFGQDTHKSMLTPLDWLKLQRSNAVKVKKNQRYLLRQCNQIQKAPNQLSAIPVFFLKKKKHSLSYCKAEQPRADGWILIFSIKRTRNWLGVDMHAYQSGTITFMNVSMSKSHVRISDAMRTNSWEKKKEIHFIARGIEFAGLPSLCRCSTGMNAPSRYWL